MRRLVLRLLREEHGQTIILFVMSVSTLLAMAGFVLDVGYFLVSRRLEQNAVDAASLGGANAWAVGQDAETVARDYATRNNFPSADLVANTNYTPCSGVRCIRAQAEKQVPKFFIQLVYRGSWYTREAAVATVAERPSPYAIMAMDETVCSSLYLNGNAVINITGGGGTYVRSNCSTALGLDGSNSRLSGAMNHVRGGWYCPGTQCTPTPTTRGLLPDPLGSLAPPNTNKPCWMGAYNYSSSPLTSLCLLTTPTARPSP